MISVNRASTKSKILDYINSTEYQKYIRDEVARVRKGGHSSIVDKSKVLTEKDMRNAVRELKKLIYTTARESGAPDSVVAELAEIMDTGIIYSSDESSATITLSFTGDLYRPSLQYISGRKMYSTGEGIDDIVSLFDTGYDASSPVYGYWVSTYDGGNKMIKSKVHRDGLYFLEEAIENFNSAYGTMYNCEAVME